MKQIMKIISPSWAVPPRRLRTLVTALARLGAVLGVPVRPLQWEREGKCTGI